MQQVTIHAAKTQLSKLIEAALAGEEVVIAKGRTPVIRLVPFVRGAFQVGMLKGQLGRSADFFQAQDETDLQLWEGGADWGSSGHPRLGVEPFGRSALVNAGFGLDRVGGRGLR